MTKLLINYRNLLHSAGAMYLLSISQIGFTSVVNQVIDARVWSSITCTRITIESNLVLHYKQFFLNNPKRIVVDLKNIKLNLALKSIEKQIRNHNRYIELVRVRQFNSNTVRIVFKLKKKTNLQIFRLKPVLKFKERLVINLHPTYNINIQDPLLILLKSYHKDNIKRQAQLVRKKLQLDIVNSNRPFVIMLDPGHGGEDFGAIGKYRTREKDVVLQVAHRLKRLIDSEKNMRAYMTRYEDIFIPLQARVAKAQKQNSDLFVSIHANAFNNCQPIGSSVFVLSPKGAANTALKYLKSTQNTTNFISGVSKQGDRYIDHAMIDMVQSITIIDSLRFGKVILNNLAKINKLHKNRVEYASFTVLEAPDIPSILIEIAFISNTEEEKKLKTSKFQQEIAYSIFSGIKTYFSDSTMLTRRY